MTYSVLVGLPIADRRTSCDFYRAVLALEPFGAPADDGVPEPLQFALNDGMRLMLIPTGGFGWVIGDRRVAAPGDSECVLSLDAADSAAVDAMIDRARAAGAKVVTEPGSQPWAYAGAFEDPDGHVWMVAASTEP
ncbi:VOC family protein [Dactylosporangium fulvum]|uniref:VOC family protein n=1 Tax=Dactylosporangium fulvum TaxID=53359 RepID=A0ABY5VZA5_9ACTN|nr:VOC family protein [Dactylosporangium fulvum]UWP82515.1 VOC family protein [Dactylosporangium fulvum]